MKRSRAVLVAAAAIGVGAGAGALVAGCRPDAVVDRRAVTLHSPRACAPGPGAYALFHAFGDFQPAADAPASEARFVTDVGAELPALPSDARALVVDVSQADSQWTGLASVPESGDIDVLVWPRAASCSLSDEAGAHLGGAAARVDARHVLVTAGDAAAGAPTPRSSVFDLATGASETLAADLLVPRARGATATAVPGSGVVVVAGGAEDRQGTAERYMQGAGFDASPIALGAPRSDHAAVALASGEVLLVGGHGPDGAPIARLEAVDASARRARTAGLASLAFPRARPTALRLASGEVLVAGGVDASGAPVPMLEWLSPDATSATHPPATLVATAERGFVALPGGGALAVIVPDAPDPGFRSVWVISAEGALEAATPVPGTLTRARLLPAPSGAPLLWTGDRWLRWDPWSGAFAPASLAPGAAGPPDGALTLLDAASDPTTADLGLTLWIDATSGVATGVRASTRSAFTVDAASAPLLHDDAEGLAPDRLVLPGVTTAIRFDAGAAGLSLDEGASVVVPDATYAGFTLDVDHQAGRRPLVALRDPSRGEVALEIGGDGCPLGDDPAATHLHVERDGTDVRVRTSSALVTCAHGVRPDARLVVALRGGPGGATARDLRVARRP